MSDLAENWNIYSSLHMLSAKLDLCRRHGGGFVKKQGFFYNFPIYAQLKNLLKRRFDDVMAALTASNTHHDLKHESSIFIWGLKQFNCAYIGKLLKNPCFFNITAAVAAVGGGGAKLLLRIAYVVRSLYFNFQPNRTIFNYV